VLDRFHGFHLVWEEAMAAAPRFGVLMAQRSRLAHLRTDRLALGASEAELARTARCEAARALAGSTAAALGSLYVMEGSTLGGQVISRALAEAPWLPPGGLTYFNPYGDRTGAMWRSFKAAAALICRPGLEPAAEAGAVATFDLLCGWLAEIPCP
jgi:heme oxygenase